MTLSACAPTIPPIEASGVRVIMWCGIRCPVFVVVEGNTRLGNDE